MLDIVYTKQFKKDYSDCKRSKKNIEKLQNVIKLLANETPLPEIYHDHTLIGDRKGHRECHIEPDWLLIYKIDKTDLILELIRTGSHSKLFR